ncbi:PREDICTED: uncharacterized protein LOC106820060, partial [Priapulus caudatus]|uniref:Uncharacterized protein LOC106820060 n=1 Tax=Priapulus caudatus TaxID=37621 RepID=A0ABM1F6N4_PRICU
IRTSIVKALQQTSLHSLGALKQTSSMLSQVTAVSEEVSPEAQVIAVSIFEDMGKFVKTKSQEHGIDDVELLDTAKFLISGISGIITGSMSAAAKVRTSSLVAIVEVNDTYAGEASVPQDQDVSLDDDRSDEQILQQSKEVAMKSFAVIEDITEAILMQKLTGEDATVITTDLISVTLEKRVATEFGGKRLGSKATGEFRIPSSASLLAQPDAGHVPDILQSQLFNTMSNLQLGSNPHCLSRPRSPPQCSHLHG